MAAGPFKRRRCELQKDLYEIPANLFFGRVTEVSGSGSAETIAYEASSEEELLHSMDLQIETEGGDYLEEDQRAGLEGQLQQTIARSGFAEEAAYLLADMVVQTNTFQENPVIQGYAASGVRAGGLGGSFPLSNRPTIQVQLNSKGSHFNGVQMKVTVSAKLQVPLGNNAEAFDFSDLEEAAVSERAAYCFFDVSLLISSSQTVPVMMDIKKIPLQIIQP